MKKVAAMQAPVPGVTAEATMNHISATSRFTAIFRIPMWRVYEVLFLVTCFQIVASIITVITKHPIDMATPIMVIYPKAGLSTESGDIKIEKDVK